jgi:thymidylate kinase
VLEVATRPLRIWARYLLTQYHQLRGRLVVYDRYVYEALLPARPPFVVAKRPYYWLLAHSLPPPRAVVLLDAPGEIAYARKHENTPEAIETERSAYAHLTTRVRSLELVDACADLDTVQAEITTIIWRELCSCWQGARPRAAGSSEPA